MKWLGLDWDIGPRIQSSGLEEISAAANTLTRDGLAYPCVCSRGDVKSSASAPQEGVSEWRYPGTCRGRFSSQAEARAQSGKDSALRFCVKPNLVTVADAFVGPKQFDVFNEVGDFPILRRDQTPAYQLAVVVDDARDGITEVVRGDDLLPSAARQQLLYEALGLTAPRWVHVPLVTDEPGRRLAKRADDLSLHELRLRGVDPRAVVSWAARSAGFVFQGMASINELTGAFQLSQIPREPVTVAPGTLSPNGQRGDC
jgi:glutamyl-tRNA synthetase